ncbi:MAG: hypothetical protein WAM11_13475 [Cyanobium sp.]
MASAFVFVLAPEALLPAEGANWSDLLQAQSHGLRSGVTLRIFTVASTTEESLEALISQGSADIRGVNPFHGSQGKLFCDALVPHIDPKALGLGVYEINDSGGDSPAECPVHAASGLAIRSIRCLDRFALRDAENETCWFYPTETGHYLSWENRRRLRTEPGFLPEIPRLEGPCEYRRDAIHVLWSLMADDRSLTCVGLTYARRRIEWPLLRSDAEECATWTAFRLDSMEEQSYEELSSISVFGAEIKP